MKRPLACVGLSMLVSLVIAVGFGYTAVVYCAVVCFVVSVILFAFKLIGKKNTLAFAVCALSACFSLTSYSFVIARYVEPLIEKYDGESAELIAEVTSKPYTKNGNTYFTVRTSQINGEEEKINIQVITSYVCSVECYDSVRINAKLYSDYETGIGYGSYYGARNIFLKTYINPYYGSGYDVITCDNKPFYSVFQTFRNSLLQSFQKYLTYDLAGFCTAVITGDKNLLPDDIYRDFKSLGVSHLLVVSGLHLSIVAEMIYSVTNKTVRNRYFSAVIQIIGILLFAALAGFGFSVIRASVMIIVMIIARVFNSRADALNSLGLAAIILCINPLNGGDIGLLWSFSTTLSLILFSRGINDYLVSRIDVKSALGKNIVSLFSTASAAFIGSLPFVVLITRSLSPYTVLVNILTVPFAGLVIICGGFGAVMFMLHLNVLAYPLMYIGGLTAKYIISVVNMFSKLPGSAVSTQKTSVYIWFAVCLIISAVIFIFDKKKAYVKLGAFAMAAALVAVYSIDYVINEDKVVLSVLDIGEGITVTLKKGDSIVVINSFGEKYQFSAIRDELSAYDRIDCMVDMPSGEYDYDYCKKIINEFNVKNVLLYDSKKFSTEYSYARYKGVNTTQIADDYTFNLYDGVQIRFIAVSGDVWCRCSIYGKDVLICPQDSDAGALPEEFSGSDIIILSDIPESCELLGDSYFVISSFGDTAEGYADTLRNMGISPALTGGMGRIDFTFEAGGEISVDREYTGGVIRWQ